MASDEAWKDMSTLFSLDRNLNQCLANYKIFFEELKRFKEDVMDDPERKAELKKLIDEHLAWTMNKITTKYSAHKTIYEYLTKE